MRLLANVFCLALLLSITACAPRGESKSLQEVVAIAKERFLLVENTAVKEEVKEQITVISASLNDLINVSHGGGALKSAQTVADSLSELLPKASYTNRPAMGALLSQYLSISQKQENQVSSAAVKLLAARTFSLIASELETAKFSL